MGCTVPGHGNRDAGHGKRDAGIGFGCWEKLETGARLKSPVAHTPPHRLSDVSGVRVNQFADWGDRDERLEGRGQGQEG